MCPSVPAWVLLVASVSFMLDHLVVTDGHWRAHDLHARETHSGQAAQNRGQQEPQILIHRNLTGELNLPVSTVLHQQKPSAFYFL